MSELFESFLKTFQDRSGNYKYRIRISQLVASGGKSLLVDYIDLMEFNVDLVHQLLQDPDSSFEEFRKAAYEAMSAENAPYAEKVRKLLTVRLRGIQDRVPLRKVDTSYLDRLIAVSGMVVRTSELRPLLLDAAFACPNEHITMQLQEGVAIKRPVKCEECDETRNFELDQKKSTFIDSQILRIQELPEELPPGQLPQFFDVDLQGETVNTARPGDRLVLTGVLRAEPDYSPGQGKLRLFRSKIEGNYIEVVGKEPEQVQITKEDEALIRSVASSADAYQKLISSVSPAIIGHEAVREAILLLLAGGPQTTLPDGTKLRGDINVLLVGDPGVAKSEMLKFAAQVAPRGLFASGRGTTAAGLSAAVLREKNVLMLEAGVVVLADQGIACLHPESAVVIDDKIVQISDLEKDVRFVTVAAQNGLSEIGGLDRSVISFDESSFRVSVAKSTKLRRRFYRGQMINLRMKSGFPLKVTPDHLLLDGNLLEWKPASQFGKGDFVVAPMKLPDSGKEIYLWDVVPNESTVSLTGEEREELRDLIQARYGSIRQASAALGLGRLVEYYRSGLQPSLQELKKICRELGVEERWRMTSHVYDKSPIRVAKLTPELGYICGFIFGDGHVRISRRRSYIFLTQSPKHREYIHEFEKCWNSAFDSLKLRKSRKSTTRIRGRVVKSERIDWSVSRRILGHIYNFITGNHLSNLLLLPNEVLKGFLAGVADSDGRNGRKISAKANRTYETWNAVFEASDDDRSNLSLLLALRRFGVIGAYKGVRKGVGIIVVSNRTDCRRLQDALSTYSVKMRRKAVARLRNISGVSEKLPRRLVSTKIRAAFDGVPRFPLMNSGIWATVYEYMNERRQPSVGQVLKIARIAPSIGSLCKSELEGLAQKDYFLDEIVEVGREDFCGFVYDIMMKGYHNYVADGVFSHNCIDEFDKMRPEDRSALHEQMEQNTITIAKGGIYATLNARTSILAALNPILGKYNAYQNLTDNINIPIPLLSRFDLIFVIKDTPTASQDEKLATHILEVHRRRGYTTPPPIQFELLKKYIAYVKKIAPTLTNEAEQRLKEYYLSLRRSVIEGQIGATPRTLESLIRLSSARARVLLRDQVLEEDALAAISLMNRMVEDVLTDAETKTRADFGVLLGKPTGERNKRVVAMDVFKALEGADKKPVERKIFKEDLVKTGRFSDEDAEKMIQTLIREGTIYESPKPGFYRRLQS